MKNLLKWLVVAALVAVGVVGNQYFSSEPILYRVLALMVLAGIAGFVALSGPAGAIWMTCVLLAVSGVAVLRRPRSS